MWFIQKSHRFLQMANYLTYDSSKPNNTVRCCCSEPLHTYLKFSNCGPSTNPPFVLHCLMDDGNTGGLGSGLQVLVATCSHGGWVQGLTVREPCLWPFYSRKEGGADERRVRFQHHETLNGLVTVPVHCTSFPTGWLSYLPWYSILRLSSAADGCRECVEEQGKAPHPRSSCWGKWGTSRAETENLMIDAVSQSSGPLPHFPRASPGSLSLMTQRGRP